MSGDKNREPGNVVGNLGKGFGCNQEGITDVETVIVLIAFVVVSSVFAFTALSTDLFATDKAKQTIHSFLAETGGTMELKRSVSGTNDVTGSAGYVSDLSFGLPTPPVVRTRICHWVRPL